jgi:hypothetical protein
MSVIIRLPDAGYRNNPSIQRDRGSDSSHVLPPHPLPALSVAQKNPLLCGFRCVSETV